MGDVTASTCRRFWLEATEFFYCSVCQRFLAGAAVVEPKLPSFGGRKFPLEAFHGFSHLLSMFHSRLRLGWLDLIFKRLGSRAMCAFAWELIPQAGHYAPLSDLIRWIQTRIQTRNLRKKRVCCCQCATNMKKYGKSKHHENHTQWMVYHCLSSFSLLSHGCKWLFPPFLEPSPAFFWCPRDPRRRLPST